MNFKLLKSNELTESNKEAIYGILLYSYQNIEGGLLRTIQKVFRPNQFYYCLFDNNKIVGVIVVRHLTTGMKLQLVGATSIRSRLEVINKCTELLNTPNRNVFVECSENLLKLLEKRGISKINTSLVKEILKTDNIEIVDEFQYKRDIGGITKTKILFGKYDHTRNTSFEIKDVSRFTKEC